MRRRIPIILTLASLCLLVGCTVFDVEYADGTKVREWGGFLVARTGSFEVRHQWLDEATNTLHEVSVTRNVDESVDAQAEAVGALSELARAYIKAQVPVPAPSPSTPVVGGE